MTLKQKDIKPLATTLINALQFKPLGQWEEIICEIMEDALYGAEFIAYFDGSAKPNPGEMKIGGRILTPGAKNVIEEYSIDLGHGTNNEAEYLSLIEIADRLVKRQATTAKIYGDSEFVIKQVTDVYKAKDPRMKIFKGRVLKLLEQIPNWKLTHIYRDQNTEADALTR